MATLHRLRLAVHLRARAAGVRADHDLGRAQAERAHAGPHRRQPREHRRLQGARPDPPAGRRDQDDHQRRHDADGRASLHPPDQPVHRGDSRDDQLRGDPVRRHATRCGARSSRSSSPTSTTASCTCSRSARSRPTARCSPAGPATTTAGMLGSIRVSAQMISYEVAMGIAVVGLFMIFGTLKLTEMGVAQQETFRVFGFLEHLGLGRAAARAWIDWITPADVGRSILQPLAVLHVPDRAHGREQARAVRHAGRRVRDRRRLLHRVQRHEVRAVHDGRVDRGRRDLGACSPRCSSAAGRCRGCRTRS